MFVFSIDKAKHKFYNSKCKENSRKQKTHPQTVLAHHRVGLHTYTQIRDQNGREFEAQRENYA